MNEQIITNDGLQYVPQLATVKQLIYLDFDGELTSYHNEDLKLDIDNVIVENSGLTKERIKQITASLNKLFATRNIIFSTDNSELAGDYSSVYIGKTSSFEPYGSFAGIAETVDSGNKNKSDNAFVILDSTADDVLIIETIAHETGHLLGTLDHGGEGLEKYKSTHLYNQTFTGELPYGEGYNHHISLWLEHLDSQSSGTTDPIIYHYDKADGAVIGDGGTLYVESGTWATNIQLKCGGEIVVRNSGTVTNLHCSGGAITNYDDLWLDNTPVFLNNSRYCGGGIWNNGNITIGNSAVFSENYASTSGGGIWNGSGGSMGIGDNALFSENINAIYNYGRMSIGNSAVFRGNHDRYGGAIFNVSGSINIGHHAGFIGNYGNDADGAIINSGGSMRIGDHAVFSGNSARYNGAVGNYCAVLSIGESAVFSGNSVTSECGGIYNYCGYVTFGGYATFTGNVAGSKGGAVYNVCSSMSFGSSAVFFGNSAKYGAAVYNGGIMTFSNGVRFSGNTADKTGAIYNLGNMEIGASAVFSGNSAAHAGAAYNDNSMIIGNYAVFSDNIAGSNGGAIYNNNCYGSMTIGDSAVFSDNIAGSNGGAIYNNNNYYGSMTIGKHAVFSGNSAASGGAVLNYGNMTIGNHAVFSGNSAASGGAVLASSATGIFGQSAGFFRNSASVNGGAIYASRCAISMGGSAVFSGNYASAGGGVYNQTGNMEFGNNTLFSGNSATSGGAVFNTSGGRVSFGNNTLFSGNSALVGGAIYNTGTVNFTGEITLATSSDTIYNQGTLNWDLTGTTIGKLNGYHWLTNAGTLTITVKAETEDFSYVLATGDFTNVTNKNTFRLGGGSVNITIGGIAIYNGLKYKLYVLDGQLILGNGYNRFIATSANPITLEEHKTYTNETVYSGCGGAGIVQAGGVLIGNTVSISGNTATGNGGAIYNLGTVSITDSTFYGNSAPSYNYYDGGAIYNSGTVSISGSTLSWNTASSGGAIYNQGTVSVSGSTLSGNTASSGGAIYNSGTVSISGSILSGNTASYAGGAIYNASNGTVSISGSILSGNTASKGGAIYNTGTVNFTGEVTLATNSDTIYNTGILNWDLTGTSTGKLNGYQWLTNYSYGKLKITVSAEPPSYSYILATGDFTNVTGKNTFIITGIAGKVDQTITIGGGKVSYNGLDYSLKVRSDKLILEIGDLHAITYVNPAWSELTQGTTVAVSGGKTAVIGSDAFSNTTDAAKVTATEGTISNEGSTPLMFTNGVSDIFTSGIIYNSGTSITIDNDILGSNVFAGEKNAACSKEISVSGTTIVLGHLYTNEYTGIVQEGTRTNIKLNVTDSTLAGSQRGVFGGASIKGTNTILENHTVTATDTKASRFVGGHRVAGALTTQGDYTLTLNNCSAMDETSVQIVMAGSMIASGGSETRIGNTTISIDGGSVNSAIIGGSMIQGSSGAEFSSITGNITMNIGGDFQMDKGAYIYGASASSKVASTKDGKVKVTGNVAITIDYSDGAILGDYVYAGGYANAEVDGDVSISLKGTPANPVQTSFKIDSRNGQFGSALVTGERELKFTGFVGQVNGDIISVSKIAIDKDSSVGLSSENLNFYDVNWDISGTAGTTGLKIDYDFEAEFTASNEFNLTCNNLTTENSWKVLDVADDVSLLDKGFDNASITFNGEEMIFVDEETGWISGSGTYMLTIDEESGDLIASKLV